MIFPVKMAAERGRCVRTQRRPGTGNGDVIFQFNISVGQFAVVDLACKGTQLRRGGNQDRSFLRAGAVQLDFLIFKRNMDRFGFAVIAFTDLKEAADILILLHIGDGIAVFADFGQSIGFVLVRLNRFTERISHGYGTALGISEFNCGADRNFRQRQRLRLGVNRNGIAVKRTFTDFKAVQF